MIIVTFVSFFAIIFALLLGYMAWYRIVVASKGTIKLDIPAATVVAGQKIRGTVTITVKKPLEARRFFVALTCRQGIPTQAGEAGDSYQVYSKEHTFLEGKQLPEGMDESFEFDFTAPSKSDIEAETKIRTDYLAKVEAGGTSVGFGNRERLVWVVEARVDLPGLDLAKSQLVHVNLG